MTDSKIPSMITCPDVAFKAVRWFNHPDNHHIAGLHARLSRYLHPELDPRTMMGRLVQSLARADVLAMKEFCESVECFARVRRRVRASHVADLCAGHGLTGLLFALFERGVERVTLLDHQPPDSFSIIRDAIIEVGPWVADKVTYVQARVQHAAEHLTPETTVIAVHACGQRTDRALEAAMAVGGHAAVMPCCYSGTGRDAPRGLREALGAELAADIQRTYRLEAAGYAVVWSAVPRVIPPITRLLVATR